VKCPAVSIDSIEQSGNLPVSNVQRECASVRCGILAVRYANNSSHSSGGVLKSVGIIHPGFIGSSRARVGEWPPQSTRSRQIFDSRRLPNKTMPNVVCLCCRFNIFFYCFSVAWLNCCYQCSSIQFINHYDRSIQFIGN